MGTGRRGVCRGRRSRDFGVLAGGRGGLLLTNCSELYRVIGHGCRDVREA